MDKQATLIGQQIAIQIHNGNWEAARNILDDACKQRQKAPQQCHPLDAALAEVFPQRIANRMERHYHAFTLRDIADVTYADLLAIPNVGESEARTVNSAIQAALAENIR